MKSIFNFTLVFLSFCLVSVMAIASTGELPAAGAKQYLFKLTYEDAEQAISQTLAEKGAATKVAALITGKRDEALYSYDKPISVEIRGLTFDKNSKNWTANLLILSEDNVISAKPLGGRYEELGEVPVLKRAVRGGEVISEADIELRDFPVNRIRPGTITNISDLAGKTPMRAVSAARPVREMEIEQPAVVQKNAIVQMRYSSAGLEISTSGQATEPGIKGQVINVRNLTSKRVVRAVIDNETTVNVLAGGAQQLSQNNGGTYAN